LSSGWVTPARDAISRVDAPSKPRSEKTSSAAARMASRVASADGRVRRDQDDGKTLFS